LKNKNKSCPYKKLSVFYNSCLKTFGSHLVSFLLSCFIGGSKRNGKPKVVQSSNALYFVLIKTMWYM